MKKNNYSSKLFRKSFCLIGSFFLLSFLISCNVDVNELEVPGDTTNKTPRITSVEPPNSALAGITVLTITGENFSPTKELNLVQFDGIDHNIDPITEVLEATTTQLKVRVPLLIKDSVVIRISISGDNQSDQFDDIYYIDLKPAVVEIFGDKDNVPSGITTDLMGNLYFNLEAFDFNVGLKKFTPAGDVEYWNKEKGSFYIDLKYGRDGRIYGTNSPPVRAIYANAFGVDAKAIPVPGTVASPKLISLDFDNNYNIWTGGRGDNIFRIKEDASDVKSFAFGPDIKSVRFFDGYIYVAAKMDSTQAIYRMQVIDSDNLGTPEVYFDVSANLGVYEVNALTFSADGRMFLGTDAELDDPNALIVVNTDGSFNTWYPGVVTGPIASFAWDTGNFLYYVREFVDENNVQKIMRIDMVTAGAPHYGRD